MREAVRTFLLAAAALLCSVLHGQQLYFGAIGGTALTRDLIAGPPVYRSIGDRRSAPAATSTPPPAVAP